MAVAARRVGEVQQVERAVDWRQGWKPLYWSYAVITIVQAFFWWWMVKYAFPHGLDSTSPGFHIYWRLLFYIELIVVGLLTGFWWSWLLKSGERIEQQPHPREEVRRIATFWSLVGATSLVLFYMASFNPNSDGSWHQTVVRDTAITPAHIPMFYFWFPLAITFSVATYLYGRTRLPAVYGADKGFPWSFFLLITAAVTEMIQVAFNEWGHSVWWPEEFFAAPFHWPFVFYGWLAAGIFALWGETILRLYQLDRAREAAEQRAAA